MLQVPARKQVSEANDHTFWHDQGGKCNANKTRMKQMNWRNLPSCVPFILLVCLSTTDHTTQEDKATAGSTCRREAHLRCPRILTLRHAPHGGPTPRSGGEPWPTMSTTGFSVKVFVSQKIRRPRGPPAPGPEFCSPGEKAESGTTV